ncbi:hypothetical protein BASA50_009466 [Batrachochytrium salamandrivorans]|uniref:Metallo-beta-lactamase domain-containing protein n=1 Tax=Batrachochytrium salamandrivorans TaxID=1357716 RepID=A0ABQ8F119_9FUNG|nr:hypothetical protein BASA62_007752 [Batrachochytrium salamandrivorans]KAH6582108.1 hypothetical protein BASA60_002122 [Batrachochytrium salamandrivorans]KAH6590204.1 hypothetical protein BASA50_009466 [Batrachochytrium salamandrivorans]KAH6602541.1 hypothetical protein BASA61_000998 [Batrachochytrium salamandrivorans]KAH9248649.1 hypothetical protein BASA81_013679 [Batrachochytrium salamandrivorans]
MHLPIPILSRASRFAGPATARLIYLAGAVGAERRAGSFLKATRAQGPRPSLFHQQIQSSASRRMLSTASTASTPTVATQIKCFFDKNGTSTCQYVIWDQLSRKAAILDPVMDFNMVTGAISFDNANQLLAFVTDENLHVEYILETHVHADHLSSSQYLKKRLSSNPMVCIGAGITQVQKTFKTVYGLDDSFSTDGSQFDRLINDNESLPLGNLTISALHTPGHTPDHLAYYIGDAVFIGDSLFMPDIGSARCDFPGGSAKMLFKSVRDRYWTLPPATRMMMGHDYPNGREARWEITIEEQQRENKHVNLSVNEDQFIEMRTTRDAVLSPPKLIHFAIQVNMRAGKFEATSGDQQTLMVRYPLSVPKESL